MFGSKIHTNSDTADCHEIRIAQANPISRRLPRKQYPYRTRDSPTSRETVLAEHHKQLSPVPGTGHAPNTPLIGAQSPSIPIPERGSARAGGVSR
jgi:hypothetical protein